MIIESETGVPLFVTAMAAGLLFLVLNLLVRPVIMLLTLPFNGFTFGFLSLLVNGIVVSLAAYFSPVMSIDSIATAVRAGFIFALVNVVLTFLIPIDDDLLYFDILEQQVRKKAKVATDGSRGIIALEIDGLAYSRLKKAIEKGKMPFLRELLQSGKFKVTAYDCGIPSQTSSCQAGIMFGNNYDICAFRWYDKERKKIISTSNFQDAEWMEKRILGEDNEHGLLTQGISVNNIMSGNALESVFTVSAVFPKSYTERTSRNVDLYLFSINPFRLTKSIIFTVFDAIVEIFEYGFAWLRRKKPRLNRLKRFYPIVRGVTNVLLRDISVDILINSIYAGRPAMYTTFIGHDEIGHHSGPDSFEAINTLYGIDRSIRKIFHAVDTNASRDYDIYILSDHGQSFGATFKQRYGYGLSDFIRKIASMCAVDMDVATVIGIENSADNDASVRAALTAFEPSAKSGPFHDKTYATMEKALNKNESIHNIDHLSIQENDILVLASGNLVNAYFSFADHRAEIAEIENHYPDLCEKLIAHPGVGLIIWMDQNQPVARGKCGSIQLATGIVDGANPLSMYGAAEDRRKQLLYFAQFPSCGDLIIFSTVFGDGTVASFEELIGSHGGLGGDQTQAFLMFPSHISVPDKILNSSEIYGILMQSRQKMETHQKKTEEALSTENQAFSFKAFFSGIRNTQKWTPLLRDVLLFQTSPYKTICADPELNGPAWLVFLFGFICFTIGINELHISQASYFRIAFTWLGGWLVNALAVYGGLKALRAKAPWSSIIRGLMFSSSFSVFWLALLIPSSSEFWVIVVFCLYLVSISISILGISNMSKIRWAISLPVVFLIVILIQVLFMVIYLSIIYLVNIEQFLIIWQKGTFLINSFLARLPEFIDLSRNKYVP